MCVTGAWGADYTVTATRVLSNSNKTCTWSVISANDNSAFENSQTALGEGLYFVASGKCTLNGAQINVKANAVMYIEVPSGTSEGSVTINGGNATDRYMETKSGGKLYMKEDNNNQGINTLAFTSTDVEDVNGVKYLQLTSKSDNKFTGVSITLTSSDEFPSLGDPEINSVKIGGVAISPSDLSELKSNHSLTVEGSNVNGMPGTLDVTVANGITTVTRTISGTTANYAFTVNEIDYTVSITNVNESHTAEGSVVYYRKNGEDAEGVETSSLTANGITFSYPTKGLSYGSATVTLGSDDYQAIKLSTGEAVSVTFPEGKVATKVIVYGWSTDGLTGYLSSLKESSGSNKAISGVGNNKFYAKNSASDVYPTVYEYDLANWESAYFQGSGSQPFVVMDFVLVDAPIVTLPTGSKDGYSCDVTESTYNRNGHPFNSQSVYTISNSGSMTLTVPATTLISKIQVIGTSDDNSNTSTITITGANNEKSSGTFVNRNSTSLSQLDFIPTTQTTSYTIESENKSSVVQISIYGTENPVSLNAKGYSTFSCASNVQVTGADAYTAQLDIENSKITCTKITDGKIPAGTGVLLYGDGGATVTVVAINENLSPLDNNDLKATTLAGGSLATMGNNTYYVLNGNTFKSYTGSAFVPGKAYFEPNNTPFEPNNTPARSLTMTFENEMTGIGNVQESKDSKADGCYNLAGQRVSNPTKGMYIMNGKKYIVK